MWLTTRYAQFTGLDKVKVAAAECFGGGIAAIIANPQETVTAWSGLVDV